MGSLCSTSRSVQVREKKTPTKRGQTNDFRMNPTPPRMQFTGESNFTHKRLCNDKDDSRNLTLRNPYAEEKIINEVKQSEEKKIVVEMENQISEDPKGNEQPESPETENAKIDASNELPNTNQSENAKIDTEAPINEIGETVNESTYSTAKQPFSPESTTVEINTPRRDLNQSLDSQDEEIKIDQPLFSHEHKSPISTEEIAQDMIPKSSGIVISPKFPVEKKTSLTSTMIDNKPESPTDNIIPESPIENALPAKTEDITVSPANKETIPETELQSETPEKIEAISPTREVITPEGELDNTVPVPIQVTPDLDNTVPLPTQATPEETGENKYLNSPELLQDNSHELTTVTSEREDRHEDPISQETEKVIEENVESVQPQGDIGNISNSDCKDLPTQDCIEANDGEINSEPAKSDTLEETIIDETAKDIIEESGEKI